MSVLSSTQKRRRRLPNKVKLKSMGDHDEFLSRIKKTLYYGKIPFTERFSLPVSELAAEIYTNVKSGHRPTLERLCIDETAEISRNACVSPCSLILALFYLERLKTCNPDYIDRVSPSELFVVSMMVASKFLHDDGEEDEVFNSEWANSAGIELNEINRYEKDFLNAMNWEVFVNETAFWTGLKGVEREVARREGRRRGWFSYTELVTLLDYIDAWSLAHTLVVVSVVCLTSYTASVMTLVGSAMIASQINVPGLIVSSNLRQQPRVDLEPINILNDNFDYKENNVTCFDKRLIGLNEEWVPSSVSHLSSLSSWDDSYDLVKENNDSSQNIIDGFFRYEIENVRDDRVVVNEGKSDVITDTIIKIMRVTLEENDRLESRDLLMSYFQESSTKTSATAIVNAMNWLNNLFPISRPAATSLSSSSVNVPSLDVTL